MIGIGPFHQPLAGTLSNQPCHGRERGIVLAYGHVAVLQVESWPHVHGPVLILAAGLYGLKFAIRLQEVQIRHQVPAHRLEQSRTVQQPRHSQERVHLHPGVDSGCAPGTGRRHPGRSLLPANRRSGPRTSPPGTAS